MYWKTVTGRLYTLFLTALFIIAVGCNDLERLKLEQLQQEKASIESETREVPEAGEATAPEAVPYGFTFDRPCYGVDAGGSVTVHYFIEEASSVEVSAPQGWSAVLNAVESEIVVSAPDPASPGDITVTATAADGRTTAAVVPVIVRDPYSDATRTYVNALGYYNIKPQWVTVENFQKLADAGIKTVTVETEDYNYRLQMDIAHQVGLRTLPIIGWVAGRYASDPEHYKGLDEMIDYLKNHPSTLAYHICDEPSTKDIPSLKLRKEKIESLDPDHPVYINLNPDGSSNSLGELYYRDYIEAYARDCECKFISFDMYPVIPGYDVMGDWYKVLTCVYEVTREYGIPFWAFAASCWIDLESTTVRAQPSVENLRLQVYTDLAYGAQVIQYFTIMQYGGTDFAPFMADGTWSRAFDILKEVNLEMQNRGFVFDGCSVKKVRHFGKLPSWSEKYDDKDLPEAIGSLSPSQDALVSFIENRGNEYVTVGNKSLTGKMTLDAVFNRMVYTIDHDGVFTEHQPGAVSFTLDEGDMLVIKVK